MPSRRTADFWLVQPLVQHTTGFEGFGATFGCLDMRDDAYLEQHRHHPIGRMHDQGPVIQPKTISDRGVTREVYFVGSPDRLEPVMRGLRFWMQRRRSKKWSHFCEYFHGRPSALYPEMAGWWSMTDDVMWTLDRHTALALFDAINREPDRHL